MPQKIVCSKCGYVLYEDEELVQPVEILRKYDSRCPHCAIPLEARNFRVMKALHA